MKYKIREVNKNNIYMLALAWKQSKAYFCVFILIILFANIKELVIVIAPKYILDSMQFGASLKTILFPVFMYVGLYLGLHIILYFYRT